MSIVELLQWVTDVLERTGIPYMLTGSTAAGWHGAGRATLDIDLVIDPQPSQLPDLVKALERPGIYVSAEAAREALDNHSMFNVVDTGTGFKADFIIRKRRAFSEIEFGRRQVVDLGDRRIWVATVEDVIITKLEWAKLGESDRQIGDVATLLRIAGEHLDLDYLKRWISALGLEPQWQAATNPDGDRGR